jgi:hypothetical protein
VSSGIAAVDMLTGGLPRGALTEIFGRASSGRTSLLVAALAEATRRQEVCALVDAGDSFHPQSAAAADMDLGRLLWIRCGETQQHNSVSPQRHRDTERIDDFEIDDCRLKTPKTNSSPRISAEERGLNWQSKIVNRPFPSAWDRRLEQVLKATDLLLQSGGFGMVVVDLADVPPRFARRIPLASWFRFRRAVENTPTVLLVVEQEPYAKTCASLVVKMQAGGRGKQQSAMKQQSAVSHQHSAREGFAQQPIFASDVPGHAQILRGLPLEAELVHARSQRKPAGSAAQFDTQAAWAGSLAG